MKLMRTYTSFDGIKILVGEDCKENDRITYDANPEQWWMHVDGGPGSHVIVCCEKDNIPKETKRDAAVLSIHHSKAPKTKSTRVNLVRVCQVLKDEKIKNHGQVYLHGEVQQLTVFMNKERDRLGRLTKPKI
mgnify:FL=1|jgi:predicted ribosome quality control (RQC) complex YloA/Tae2 family protein